MREIRDWRKGRNDRPLSPEKLASILRQITTEEDATRTYERLTGKRIPDKEENNEPRSKEG